MLERHRDGVAVIPLDFDHAIFERPPTPACLFEVFCQGFVVVRGQVQVFDQRHHFAAAAYVPAAFYCFSARRPVALGAVMALGVMAGAILSHLTVLGIEVKGDGGLLFGLALIVFVSSAIVLTIRRAQLPVVGHYFELA
jgi:hypothetical protein